MANPILPGIPEAEQALLYRKLNDYNQGRSSYKEAGTYLVVLSPAPTIRATHYGSTPPCPDASPSSTYKTFPKTSTKACEPQAPSATTRPAACY